MIFLKQTLTFISLCQSRDVYIGNQIVWRITSHDKDDARNKDTQSPSVDWNFMADLKMIRWDSG